MICLIPFKKPEHENPKQPKTKPKPVPENVEFAALKAQEFATLKSQVDKEKMDSYKEFWASVGEQVWSIPNASPVLNIEREWKMAHGLMEEVRRSSFDHLITHRNLV